MEELEASRVEHFFRSVTDRFPAAPDTASVVVTHLVDGRPVFLSAAARATDLRAILPKPRSVQADVLTQAEKVATCDRLSRADFADPRFVLEYLENRAPRRDLVIADVGGYFAPALGHLAKEYSGRIVAVVEDTENGHQRYAAMSDHSVPVFSVARSPLKVAEDYLVGHSVIFSVEALIRGHGDIMSCRRACVIGFGKIGSSAASLLRAKGLPVVVFDADPVKRTQALSMGYQVAGTLAEATAGAGIVIGATGNVSLPAAAFSRLANGAYVASVTSSDDEMDLDGVADLYHRTQVAPHVTRYDTTGHYFYLLADGNAVNFVHGASAGSFIYLVQAEILADIGLATTGSHVSGMHEADPQTRMFIADSWLATFTKEHPHARHH
ncbi:adenosylhomocysteinase [Kitasatospora griseola]|uniref:adenosylhomocysteinase n=1 Tax=Kitasatospora griseola TaxID=2064 RepID=UPI0037F5D59D